MYFYSKIARNPKFLSHCPIMNWVTSDQHSPMKRCQFSTRIPRPCRPDTQFYIHDIVQVSGYHKPLQLHWREPNHSCWVLMPKDCIEPMYGTLKDSNVRLVLLSSQEFGYFLIGALQKRIVSVIWLCLEISYPQSTCLIIILIYILFMFQNVLYFHMWFFGVYPGFFPNFGIHTLQPFLWRYTMAATLQIWSCVFLPESSSIRVHTAACAALGSNEKLAPARTTTR